MNNLAYWEKRKEEEMSAVVESTEKTMARLKTVYDDSAKILKDKIKNIFLTYKAKYHLTDFEAMALLSKVNSPTDVETIKALLEADPNNAQLMAELESGAYGSRISRLASVLENIDKYVVPILIATGKYSQDLFQELAEDQYYKTIYTMHKQSGYGFSFKTLSQQNVDKVINQPWYGTSFSESIWGNTNKLAEDLRRELMINLLTGRSLKEAQDAIDKRYNAGYSNARRLIRTEANYVTNQITKTAYENADIEKYIYLAILDLRTSKICQTLDKQVFAVSTAKVGWNYPPMHPYCRSTTLAYIDSEAIKHMKQRALDPKTGKHILVSGDMTYREWYKTYVK